MFVLCVACEGESTDADELELAEEEFEPDSLVFDEDPVTVTGVRIGTKSDPNASPRRPPGLQPDGTFDLALVPEWIPVSAGGEVVGYARKEHVHPAPSTPEESLAGSEVPIYDEDAEVIGRFENGLPRLDMDLVSERGETEHHVDFSLTVREVSAAWPLPLSQIWYLANWVPAPGYTGECARHDSGSYGSVFFNNSVAFHSWGGNCNAFNARPPGWLRSQTWTYDVTGYLLADTGLTANGAWTHVHQTTLPNSPSRYFWCGRSDYYLSTASVFTSKTHCAS